MESPPAGTAMLRIEDLATGYRGRQIFDGLTLSPIPAGQVTALVGPNAAGKTTLLRALAGLLPAEGAVRLGEIDLLRLGLGERAQHVGFMPQSLPQGAVLTVIEGVISALKAAPVQGFPGSAAAVRERAMAMLERLGIADLALSPLGKLSGGQRQMASLAQAMVREPHLLLLDEPTSALDLKHQFYVMNTVRQVARSGRIVIVVLHDLALATAFADRVVVLSEGRVAAEGSPAAAVTPEMLAAVYGVAARVESCSCGKMQIMVDGIAAEAP